MKHSKKDWKIDNTNPMYEHAGRQVFLLFKFMVLIREDTLTSRGICDHYRINK